MAKATTTMEHFQSNIGLWPQLITQLITQLAIQLTSQWATQWSIPRREQSKVVGAFELASR